MRPSLGHCTRANALVCFAHAVPPAPIMSRTHPDRIGLFGGTFDPVHHGHLEIAARARDALELTQVRFLPCRVSPHKTDRPPASGEDRLAMLRLATSALPWAVVDDFELHAPGPSYSYLTAEEMQLRHPDARLFWILGRDQWNALSRWRHPDRLAARVEFIVFDRDGIPAPRPGWTMHPVPGSHPASSTAIREALRSTYAMPNWLDPRVADYIRRHHLYRD